MKNNFAVNNITRKNFDKKLKFLLKWNFRLFRTNSAYLEAISTLSLGLWAVSLFSHCLTTNIYSSLTVSLLKSLILRSIVSTSLRNDVKRKIVKFLIMAASIRLSNMCSKSETCLVGLQNHHRASASLIIKI